MFYNTTKRTYIRYGNNFNLSSFHNEQIKFLKISTNFAKFNINIQKIVIKQFKAKSNTVDEQQ